MKYYIHKVIREDLTEPEYPMVWTEYRICLSLVLPPSFENCLGWAFNEDDVINEVFALGAIEYEFVKTDEE